MESWLEMAIVMMKPIMLVVFMMEVTVAESVSIQSFASLACVMQMLHQQTTFLVSNILLSYTWILSFKHSFWF